MKHLSTLLVGLIVGLAVFATTQALADDPPPFDPASPDSIPVDGGVSLLAGLGGAYGFRRLRARQQASK